jgi:propionyl-CoA carboxylase beta chain
VHPVYRRIETAGDPAALRTARTAEYRQASANPFVTAARGFIDRVIVRDTRPTAIAAPRALDTTRDRNPPRKHGNPP